jgi:hypothetical protein
MRDHHQRKVPAEVADGFDHGRLRVAIQCIGRLVKHQNGGMFVKRAGDPNALALASGESDAALADARVVTCVEALDKIRYASSLSRESDTLAIYLLG